MTDSGFDTSGNPHQGGAAGARAEESGRGGAGQRAEGLAMRSKLEERARFEYQIEELNNKFIKIGQHHLQL